jgi:ribulose-5-phosphate 4-epimerase/fuculose-1-phosphate aldolase
MEGKRPLEAISHGDVVLPGIPTFVSFEPHRQHIKEHLAAAFRHWSREGYVLGISGHISVRDPEFPDCLWFNPLGRHFGLLKASDMVMVNINDGKVVGGNRSRPPNAAGYLIHAPIHRLRPDVHAVCHAHTKYGKAWSTFGLPLEMLTQDACKFYNAHAVYNQYGGVVLAEEEGEMIAKALGETNKGVILRNHGLLTVGGTVDEAAWLFLTMEKACEGQILAEMAAANDLKKVVINDEEASYTFRMESDVETSYAEFQAYYEYEEEMDSSFKG